MNKKFLGIFTVLLFVLTANISFSKDKKPVQPAVLDMSKYQINDYIAGFFTDEYFYLQDYLLVANFPRAYANYQENGNEYVFKNLSTKKPVLAILSWGFNPSYDDTLNHIWVNPNEVPNNLKDDDNNGYTDDYNIIHFRSRNYVTSYNISYYADKEYLLENYPGYLSQVYIGSTIGNKEKYAGTLFDENIKLMLIDISGDLPAGTNSGITYFEAGIKYILNMKDRGVNIIGALFAVPESVQFLNVKYPLIKEMSDRRIFFIMPSGSYTDNLGGYIGKNIDLDSSNPCNLKAKYEYDKHIKLDNFLCVGMLDRTNKLTYDPMSNFGDYAVDFITPGKFTMETQDNTIYSSLFSASLVASAVANAKIMYPEYSNSQLKELLYSAGDVQVNTSKSRILLDFTKLFKQDNETGLGNTNLNLNILGD